jgi:hypothetical protein
MSNRARTRLGTTTKGERTGKRRAGRLTRALGDLHECRVFRTAATYTVVMWLILQMADVAFPLLGIPLVALKTVAVVAVLGFPVAVVVAWIWQITPDGIVIYRASSAASWRTERSDLIVNLLLLAVGSVLAMALLRWVAVAGEAEAPRIAIKVTDLAGADASTATLAPGLERELRQQLVNTTRLEPMSVERVRDPQQNVKLMLWVSILTEENRVCVRTLLLSA